MCNGEVVWKATPWRVFTKRHPTARMRIPSSVRMTHRRHVRTTVNTISITKTTIQRWLFARKWHSCNLWAYCPSIKAQREISFERMMSTSIGWHVIFNMQWAKPTIYPARRKQCKHMEFHSAERSTRTSCLVINSKWNELRKRTSPPIPTRSLCVHFQWSYLNQRASATRSSNRKILQAARRRLLTCRILFLHLRPRPHCSIPMMNIQQHRRRWILDAWLCFFRSLILSVSLFLVCSHARSLFCALNLSQRKEH